MNPIKAICDSVLGVVGCNECVVVGVVLLAMIGFFGVLFVIGWGLTLLAEKYWLTK